MQPDPPSPNANKPWTPELFMLGLAFIGAGAALGSWFDAFRLLGIALILIGVAILVLAAAQPMRGLAGARGVGALRPRQWLLPGMLLLVVCAAGILAWRWQQENDARRLALDAPATDAAEVSCIAAAGQCVFHAESRAPGEPLVWNLPVTLTAGAADGSLAVDARLEGDVAGRYLAIACRSIVPDGEYVLVVRPENQSFRLIRWDGAQQVELAAERLPRIVQPATSVNRLDLSCMGSTISAAINGTPVASRQDDRHKSGNWYVAAGIFAEDTQSGPVSARFDNLDMSPTAPTG